eukprot:3887013-Prymnesium_polylepis.1
MQSASGGGGAHSTHLTGCVFAPDLSGVFHGVPLRSGGRPEWFSDTAEERSSVQSVATTCQPPPPPSARSHAASASTREPSHLLGFVFVRGTREPGPFCSRRARLQRIHAQVEGLLACGLRLALLTGRQPAHSLHLPLRPQCGGGRQVIELKDRWHTATQGWLACPFLAVVRTP